MALMRPCSKRNWAQSITQKHTFERPVGTLRRIQPMPNSSIGAGARFFER